MTEENKEQTEDMNGKFYRVCGSIISVMNEKNFYYVACNGCRKKTQSEICENCHEAKGSKITYTFNINVSDGTSSIWLHVFGEEGEKLLGRTAEKMKELMEQDQHEYKQAFDNIRGKVKHIKAYYVESRIFN